MKKLRVGAVSYLNTKPLVFGLRGRLGDSELIFDLPSRLADQLHAGSLDVALIPSVEYLRHADAYEIVSDACIACRGPVWSVRLLSRVPVPEIKTLALDEGSRTSAALVQVLLKQQYGLSPDLLPMPIDASPDQAAADAVLLIGDRAMHPTTGLYQEIWDLGDRWCRWSELPFVFAMWVRRREAQCDEIAAMLQTSRDEGVRHLEQLANQYAGAHGLTVADCLAYLSRYLHFTLGTGERQGLDLFQAKATELGLVEAPTGKQASLHHSNQ